MDYETILSTFDKRITLLQWLKQLTELLKDIKTEEEVTADSVNPVESKGIYTFVMDNIAILRSALELSIASKQDILMSGQNIKTVNGVSLLGSGDLQAGGQLYKHNVVMKGYDEESTLKLIILSSSPTVANDMNKALSLILNGIVCNANKDCNYYDASVSNTFYGVVIKTAYIDTDEYEGVYINMAVNPADDIQELGMTFVNFSDTVTAL